MFVHYLLARQLLTDKKYELWWLFAGKPIRYAIADFACVTGLNCSPLECVTESNSKHSNGRRKYSGKGKGKTKAEEGAVWKTLFGKDKKPTTGWILDRLLLEKKYKEPLTRFRMSLLLLVEGILCPTCGSKNIRP